MLSTSFTTPETHIQGIPSHSLARIKEGDNGKPSLSHALNDLHSGVSDKLSTLLSSSHKDHNISTGCNLPSINTTKPAYILFSLLRELSKPEDERLQWLFWVDADTTLLNPNVRIETFLLPSSEFDDVHLVVSRDWNGLNNGVFPVRVNQWVVELFAAIVAFRTHRPETKLTFRDQEAMDLLLKEKKLAAHVVEAPQRWFNAYPGEEKDVMLPFQVRRGDFLVHFPGMGTRDEIMAMWPDRVERHLPEWEVDVGHTTYPAEAKEIWREQRELRADRVMTLVDMRRQAIELVKKVEAEMGEYRPKITEKKATDVFEKMAALKEIIDIDDSVVKDFEDAMAGLKSVRYQKSRTRILLTLVRKGCYST